MTFVSKSHPAKFSNKILIEIRYVLQQYMQGRPYSGYPYQLIDPFAGIGGVHSLAIPDMLHTWGIELEPEWALNDSRTLVGDARNLPWEDQSFDFAISSPCYGNRMADSHDAQERCRACKGTGAGENGIDCKKCDGKGFRKYKRNTYTHIIGRKLTSGNAGAMQWGQEYRDLHREAWAELYRVLKSDTGSGPSVFVMNISDHIRKGEVVEVSRWHRETCEQIGFKFTRQIDVKTPRNRQGANRDLRVETEHIFVFEKP